MWILLVVTFLGFIAWPVELVLCQIFQGYMIWESVVSWLDVVLYDNDSYYQFEIGIMLFLANFYTWLAMTAFLINMLFPIIGPLGNIMIMYWVFIEWDRLQLPLWGGNQQVEDDTTRKQPRV